MSLLEGFVSWYLLFCLLRSKPTVTKTLITITVIVIVIVIIIYIIIIFRGALAAF